MVLLTSSSAAAVFLLAGIIPLDYALAFGAVACVGGFVGKAGVAMLVRKYRAVSRRAQGRAVAQRAVAARWLLPNCSFWPLSQPSACCASPLLVASASAPANLAFRAHWLPAHLILSPYRPNAFAPPSRRLPSHPQPPSWAVRHHHPAPRWSHRRLNVCYHGGGSPRPPRQVERGHAAEQFRAACPVL